MTEQVPSRSTPTDAARSSPVPVDRLVAILGVVGIVLVFASLPSRLAGVAIFAIWLLVPGWAIVSRARIRDTSARIALTIIASIVTAAVLSLAMVWSGFWHPAGAGIAVLAVASIVLGFLPRDGALDVRSLPAQVGSWARSGLRRTGPVGWVLWAALLVATVLWAVSLTLLSDSSLAGEDGTFVFPPLWYAAVFLVLLVSIGTLSVTSSSATLSAVSVTLLNVVFFASTSFVQGVPRLPWTYKHIAVSNFIDATGSVNPAIDLYHRWPAFFSTAASLGHLSGFSDPVDWAGWTEVGFALVDVLLVFALARAVTRSSTIPWVAAVAFTTCNWIGQNYFSPQAFDFSLYLALCLVAVTFLRSTPLGWIVRTEERFSARRFFRPTHDVAAVSQQATDGVSPLLVSRKAKVLAVCAVLLLQAVIVASHQLTPYIAIACLLPLFLLGYFRPRWLGVALVAVALAYLVPNFDYINDNYGLLTGFDLVSNASYTPPEAVNTSSADIWHGRGVSLLSLIAVGLGFLGIVRHAFVGSLRNAVLVAIFAFAPAVILAGQSYGGEGRFRVLLFALPWLSIGIGWLFDAGGTRWRRSAFTLRSLALLVTGSLFILTSFQPILGSRVESADVPAAQWLDSQLKPGDFLMGDVVTFPTLIGANYPILIASPNETRVLSDFFEYSTPDTDADDLKYSVGSVGGLGHTYLVFADSQRPLLSSDMVAFLDRIEASIQNDPEIPLVHDTGRVRIYRVDAPAGVLASDDFLRDSTDTWDTAETGRWSLSEESSQYSVANEQGVMTTAGPGSSPTARLENVSSSATEVSAEISFDRTPVAGTLAASLIARGIDSENDYRVRVVVDGTYNPVLELISRVDGIDQVVATSPATLPGSVFVPNVSYTLAVTAVSSGDNTSTQLQAKLWPTDAVEPAWQVSAEDGAAPLQAPGSVGIATYESADATAPITLSVYAFRADSLG